jgi:AraC family transcriptional regulator
LDGSKVIEGSTFQGQEIELHRYSGARVLRVVHPERQEIDEHRHDWAYVGIYTLGCYREIYDGGEALMSGPCAVLHPAGRPHADLVEDAGLETLTIEFDPAWLRRQGFDRRLDRSQIWDGGQVGLAAKRLSEILTYPQSSETRVGEATSRFLRLAYRSERSTQPAWLDRVHQALEATITPTTVELADRLGLHPAWLARAYRSATGEGMHETLRRRRVERACKLLRHSDIALAEVADSAGFCDQSHMNRCFRAVLGRSPARVRTERSASPGLRSLGASVY